MKKNKLSLIVNMIFSGIMYVFFFLGGMLPDLLMILSGHAHTVGIPNKEYLIPGSAIAKYVPAIIIAWFVLSYILSNNNKFGTYNEIWKTPYKIIAVIGGITVLLSIYITANIASAAIIWGPLSVIWVAMFCNYANVLINMARFPLSEKTISELLDEGKSALVKELIRKYPSSINYMAESIRSQYV